MPRQIIRDFAASVDRLFVVEELEPLVENEVRAMGLRRQVTQNTTINWTVKESVKARLRVLARRALRKYGYPPDLEDAAVKTVLQQAELLALDQAA